jgi:predicted ATPase
MKIYCSGSHSVGKSTICRYISQKYNLPIINETARQILAENELNINTLRCDLDIADKYQKDVFNRQLLEEQKHASFVSDRSLIDILAYTGSHARILPELLKQPELRLYIDSLKLPDTILFFVRPSKATLHQDGTREILNFDGIVAIDAMIKLFLEMFEIRYFEINTDSMQSRCKLIDNVLSLVK